MGENRKVIVVSGINFFNGGPLTVMKDCLFELSKIQYSDYSIVALVHKRELYSQFLGNKNIRFIEFPKSRASWIFRIFYEYIYFYFLSRKLRPYLWLSMHDISPNVVAQKQVVYCHNPSPFYDITLAEAKMDFKFFLFNKLYSLLYRFNIKSNNWIIVQQNWLRDIFSKRYGLNNVIVALPQKEKTMSLGYNDKVIRDSNNIKFVYPALPRIFKNFELICDAVAELKDRNITSFEVIFTISGSENSYAKWIHKKYGYLDNIKFRGLQSPEDMRKLYKETQCLIFPSKLETWGLPITEAKELNMPIFLLDVGYAKETVGDYENVQFFKNKHELAECIELYLKGSLDFQGSTAAVIDMPFTRSWNELFNYILFE